jgi:hypothetical protein
MYKSRFCDGLRTVSFSKLLFAVIFYHIGEA